MVRHLCDEKFSGPQAAREIHENDVDSIKANLIKYFNTRMSKWESSTNNEIKNILKQENLDYINDYLDEAILQWLNKKDRYQNLYYKKHGERDYLYNEEGDLSDNEDTSHWNISGSLRVIEPNSVIKIK